MDELIVEPHLQYFWEDVQTCIKTAWEYWVSCSGTNPIYFNPLTPSTRASFVNDHIKANVKAIFGNNPETYRIITSKNGIGLELIYEDILSIRFKKLTNGRPSNIPTKHQTKLFYYQLPMANIPPLSNLTAGYSLNPAGIAMESMSLLYEERGRLIWTKDVEINGTELGVSELYQSDYVPETQLRAKGGKRRTQS